MSYRRKLELLRQIEDMLAPRPAPRGWLSNELDAARSAVRELRRMIVNPEMPELTIFDSDGNPIAGPFDLADIDGAHDLGMAIAEHYALVARTEGASEPFVTVRVEEDK